MSSYPIKFYLALMIASTTGIGAAEQMDSPSLADLARQSHFPNNIEPTVDGFLQLATSCEHEYHLPTFSARKSYWLEDPQLRIEPSEDQQKQKSQQYKLRFKPTTQKTRAYRSDLDDTATQIAKLKCEAQRDEALLNRYQTLVRLAALEAQLAIAKSRVDLAEKMLEHAKIPSSAAQQDVQDLQSTAITLEKRRGHVSQIEQQLGYLRDATVGDYYRIADIEEPFLTVELIDPARIENWLLAKPFNTETIAEATRLAASRLTAAENALALEKAESSLGLDFLELSYSNDNTDSYSMTFGIRLPFARSTQSLRDKSRAVIEEQDRHTQSTWQLRQAMTSKTSLILAKTRSYEGAHTTLKRVRKEVAETTTVSSFNTLRSYELDTLERIVELHVAVLNGWLGILHTLGELGKATENVLRGGDRATH